MKVEVRFLPGQMDKAYILYEGTRFPLVRTDKNANAITKRNNPYPAIEYPTEGGAIA